MNKEKSVIFENIELIEITSKQEPESGFQDIVLTITEYKIDKNGYYLIIGKGKYKNKEVGLKFTVNGNMKNGIIEGNIDKSAFFKDGIAIESIGEISNNFIQILSSLYRLPLKENFSSNKIYFTCFPLEEKDFKLENDDIKTKLFYEDPTNANLYCEIFCNINIPKKEIELLEKDEEYRDNILKIMSN